MARFPSTERLNALLDLDKETGHLTWRERDISEFKSLRASRSWNGRYAGTRAGYLRHGYLIVSIDDVDIRAHRLVWAMHYGTPPLLDIDHINHVRDDNRIENLRQVTRGENTRNASLNRLNRSGHAGVYQCRKTGTWKAEIGDYRSRDRHIGSFKTIDAAVAARKAAEAERGFHENHGASHRS